MIYRTAVADDAPTPAGGEIVSGTYAITAETYYGGADCSVDPIPLQATFAFAAVDLIEGAIEMVVEPGGHATFSYALDDTDITMLQTCPGPAESAFSYTATPDEILIFDMDVSCGDALVTTLTRQ